MLNDKMVLACAENLIDQWAEQDDRKNRPLTKIEVAEASAKGTLAVLKATQLIK